VVLAVVSAALLAATLGLAWLQVHAARALGPEQRVGDTPLIVRLPKDWRPQADRDGYFVLPMSDETRRRTGLRYERRVRFQYEPLQTFHGIAYLYDALGLEELGELVDRRPARIGRFDAIQVHLRSTRVYRRGGIATIEQLVRFTCLPRGQMIAVWYDPLVDLRPADFEILDEVCQSLQIDDPSVSASPDELLKRAGLEMPVSADWVVVGPHFDPVPGLYVGGSRDGIPIWSIGIFRTWLARGREPHDLLRDFAANYWMVSPDENDVREFRRADGVMVTEMRHPNFGLTEEPVSSVWMISQSPSLSGILYVCAEANAAAAASEVAGGIAESLRMSSLGAAADLDSTEQAGRELVSRLRKVGPVPRWGRDPMETAYQRRDRNEAVVITRHAVDRDPEQGYEGGTYRRIGRSREETTKWTLDGRAAKYVWQADFLREQVRMRVTERRTSSSGEATRLVLTDGRERAQWSFMPGPAFVPPPAESIIEGWVARHEVSAAAVEYSSLLGPGAYSALLRSLPPDGDHPRVLLQRDYWPLGVILAFDDERGEMVYEQSPSARYDRVEARSERR